MIFCDFFLLFIIKSFSFLFFYFLIIHCEKIRTWRFSRLKGMKSTLELNTALTLHNKNLRRNSKMKQQEPKPRESFSERIFENESASLGSLKSTKATCMCRRNFHDGSSMTNLPIKSMRWSENQPPLKCYFPQFENYCFDCTNWEWAFSTGESWQMQKWN